MTVVRVYVVISMNVIIVVYTDTVVYTTPLANTIIFPHRQPRYQRNKHCLLAASVLLSEHVTPQFVSNNFRNGIINIPHTRV